jgi:hypothetical protein
VKLIYGKSVAIICVLLLPSALLAQTDPPERIARINLIEGAISYLPSGGGDNDWVAATINRPLTTGDRLWADSNSRCELHIGSAAIRMNRSTGISFLNLDDTNVQIRLSDGSIILHLRHLEPGDTYEVDTPNLAFSINRPGNYRVDSFPDQNQSVITVRQGEGEVIGGGRSWQVISDQQVTLTGTDSLAYDLRDADLQPLNDFDRWANSRDEREARAAAPRYVSREMTGYEDLDAYGVWTYVPGYGWCWRPAGTPVGWAPYRYGHWVWIAPWGWTWVEDEPWGFAPFHYGRWAFYGGGWMWVPGPVGPRPVYAPALVAWVGGNGFSFSVSLGARGGIGWFPLGPREVFLPAYRVSERYVTNVNVTNTVVNRVTVVNVYKSQNLQNATYANRVAPNAVTIVSHENFVSARPVAQNIVNVPPRELASAPVSHISSVEPERLSVYGAGSRNAPHPPAQVMNRLVVAKQNPPPEPNHFGRLQNATAGQPPSGPANPVPAQQSGGTRPPQARPVPENQQMRQPAKPLEATAEKPPQTPRPLTRPAPTVRPPTSKEQSDMKAKQKAWENAHSRNKPKGESKDQKSP